MHSTFRHRLTAYVSIANTLWERGGGGGGPPPAPPPTPPPETHQPPNPHKLNRTQGVLLPPGGRGVGGVGTTGFVH